MYQHIVSAHINISRRKGNPDNEPWSVNRIKPDKILFLKNRAGNEAGRLVPNPCLFLEKNFIRGKSNWSAELRSNLFSRKRPGNS